MTAMTTTVRQRLLAEFLGTFVLVLGGCGAAVFSSTFSRGSLTAGSSGPLGVGVLGVALGFGLAYIAVAYAVGHVSGAHFNPAVTVGLAVARRFVWRDVPAYVLAQVLGGLLAGLVLWGVARDQAGWNRIGSMAANGYGSRSPGGFGLVAVFVAEAVFTAVLVYVVLGVTDSRSPDGLEPLTIGLAFALANLVLIPISGGSANPARSTGVAFFNGDGAGVQLWAFWVAPLIGAAIAGATFHLVTGIDRRDRDISGSIAPEDVRVPSGVDPDAARTPRRRPFRIRANG